MDKIKQYILKLHKKGFSSIVLANMLANIVTFAGGIILVRVLPKNEYGYYSYAINTFNMLIIVGDLGISSAVMQFASENYKIPDKVNAYIKYALKGIIILSLMPVLIVGTSTIWYPHTMIEARKIVGYLFLVPIFQNLNLFTLVILRVYLKNNQYALVNTINCILHYLFVLIFAYKGGWTGAVIAKYPTIIITLLVCVYFVKNIDGSKACNVALKKKEKITFLKFAIVKQINAISSTLMNIIDVYCIGLLVADSNIIASYKSASVLPTALNFIPQSVMVFMVPYFSRNVCNKSWVRKTYKKVWIGNLITCILIATIGVISAPFVIPLIFGNDYKDAIPCFIILLIGFVFYGGFQCPAINILNTQRKLGVVFALTICGAVLNTLLNIILINSKGSIGAAFATTIVHVIVGVIANIFLYSIIKEEPNNACD